VLRTCVLNCSMKSNLHRCLASAILTVALLGSSVGLPIVTVTCPVMHRCSMGFSCCKGETNRPGTKPSPSTSYTCCLRTMLVSPLRFESTESKSTNFVHQERTGFSSPSGAVSSYSLTQNPSLIVPLVAGFGPPGNSYQLTLPLRI
jgi:hypothetical protein